MNVCRILGTMAIAVTAMMLADVAAARVSPSSYCVAIDVTSETAEGLALRFDDFARSVDLEIDDSHPMARVYYPSGDGVRYPTDSTVIIDLARMGPLGSILSYHPLRGDPSPGLPEALEHFVRDKIAQDYGVRNCADIEGFTAPVIYH